MSTSASPRDSRTRAILVACCLLAATAAAPVMAQGGSPGPSEVAPTSVAPVSQTPAGATPGSAELVLSRVTLPDGLPKVPLTSVIAGGPGYIAVGGGAPQDGGPSQPLILTSADGVAWTTVGLGGVGDPGYLDDVVAFPGGFAAVGSGGGTDGQDAVALVSPDGLQWRESHDHDLRGTQMVGVAAWADGLFAVGIINEFDPIGFTSTDGRAWTRVPVPGRFTPDSVAAAEGLLAVVGTAGVIADGQPVIATTTDLNDWTRRKLKFGGVLREADVLGKHIVAAGVDLNVLSGEDRGVLVYSPDAGQRWIQLPETAPIHSGFEGISTAGPTIAYGTQLDADLIGHPAAWITRFGVDWQRLRTSRAAKGRGDIFDFVPFPDRPGGIAVGGAGAASGSPAIWVIGPAGG